MTMRKNLDSRHCKNCPSKGQGIFCELENIALDDLNKQKIVNTFKKGQTLFVEGAPPFGIFCIAKGNIKLTKTSSVGKEAIVRIATNGDVLGHRSALVGENYTATAVALEDTEVCFIDKKYIVNFLRKEPSVASQLMLKLGRELGASENRVASFTGKSVFERTCETLLILKESHGVNNDEGILLDLKVTREELASIVGTATETVIRILSDLKKEKLIGQNGKNIVLYNTEKLFEYSSL